MPSPSAFPGISQALALVVDQTLGVEGAKPPGYRDYYGKVSPATLDSCLAGTHENSQKCPSFYTTGVCPNGHRWAKKLICGQEWCPACGEKESEAHMRRIARMLPKVQQMSSIGQFVIEFPLKYRPVRGYVHSKRGLRLATNLIVDVLAGKRTHARKRGHGFFRRGIVRWHWFGDPVNGSATWNPHANVLVDAGYLDAKMLLKIKGELRKALKCPDLIVNYSYTSSPAKKWHMVKYITRATFLRKGWDEYMAAELFNFRNIRYWGKWDDPPAWATQEAEETDDLVALEAGLCPDCGEPIRWDSKPHPIAYLQIEEPLQELPGGYYRLKPFPQKIREGAY